MSITGDRIKELRLRNDWTQEALGEKIGLKKAAVNKYELGIVENIKRQTLLDLAEVLGTTPNYLMGWEDEPNGDIQTIAAHHDDEEWTEEELEEIEAFKEFVKSKRKK
ncbi:helix-turn-helix transcriptional regulator [Vallitaleaceae bacterium 9-2]